MSASRPRRAHRAAALICSSLALGVAGLAGASSAQAASDSQTCNGLIGSRTCSWARHTLTSVKGTGPAGWTVGAGASWDGTQDGLYANWAWGSGSTCHDYGAGNLLYPIIKNGTGSTGNFYGLSTYGSGAASC